MNKKIVPIILIALSLIVGFAGGRNYATKKTPITTSPSVVEATSTVSVIINSGAGFAAVFPRESITEGDTLFSVLDKVTKEQKVEFIYKDYGGDLGVFINSLNGKAGSKDKWWQYWVNGKYATVGVSGYKPQAGDVIEFRLTREQ